MQGASVSGTACAPRPPGAVGSAIPPFPHFPTVASFHNFIIPPVGTHDVSTFVRQNLGVVSLPLNDSG